MEPERLIVTVDRDPDTDSRIGENGPPLWSVVMSRLAEFFLDLRPDETAYLQTFRSQSILVDASVLGKQSDSFGSVESFGLG